MMITGLYNVIIASQCIIYYIIDNSYARCQEPILPLKIPVSTLKSTDNSSARLLSCYVCWGMTMQTGMYRTFTYRVPRWQCKRNRMTRNRIEVIVCQTTVL
jgi:hypothetical protein